MAALPRLIVVTGPPGPAQRTIAAARKARLGLPLIAKDALKETLGDALDFDGDRHESQRLRGATLHNQLAVLARPLPGGASFHIQLAVVRELLAARVSLIAEGNFRGDWFDTLPPARLTQLHAWAAP